MNKTFTLTYGDCAENHKGMQIIGTPSTKGYSAEDINAAKIWFESKGASCELHKLNILAEYESVLPQAIVLIVRKRADIILKEIGKTSDDFLTEQDALPKDSKAFMYGRVVNKHARHNL